MVMYAIYYIVNLLVHLDNGKIVKEYDWYGFVIGDTYTIIISLAVILLITYFISYFIYKCHRKYAR